MAGFNGFCSFYNPGHKLIVNAFMHQNTRRTSADFSLVQRKKYSAFNGFVEEIVVGTGNGGEEMIGGFAAYSHSSRNNVFRCILKDQAACGGFSGKRYFGNTW